MPTVLCKTSGGGNIVLRPQSRPRWYPAASVDAALVEVWEHDEDEPRSAARLVGVFRPGDKGSVPFNPQTDRNKTFYTVARSAAGTPDVSSLSDALSASVILNRMIDAPSVTQSGAAMKDEIVLAIEGYDKRLAVRRIVRIADNPEMTGALEQVTVSGKANLERLHIIGRTAIAGTAAQNIALSGAGAVATSSGGLGVPYTPDKAINGDRLFGEDNGFIAGAGGTTILEVDFGQMREVNRVGVIGIQDVYNTTEPPTLETVGTVFVNQDFSIELFTDVAWVQVASVTNDDKVWRQFDFATVSASRMRILITRGSADNDYRRVVELEAYTQTQSALAQTIYVQIAHSARLTGGGSSWSAFSAVQPYTFASSADPLSGSSGDAEIVPRNKFDYEPVQ